MNGSIWKGWAALAAAIWLAGCAVLPAPRSVEVTRSQLQQWIDREFPVDGRALEWLDLRVAAPALTLRPQDNRLQTTFELSVGQSLLNRPLRATLVLDHGLRYEPADHSVRLTDLRVERIGFDGAAAPLRGQLERHGVRLVERLLDDRPIYTLRPDAVEALRGRGLRPDAIRVTPAGLSITLVPLEPR
ncbi:MAG: DUF1439 domain-containing protein [Burkholderiaceae bacterium]